MTKTESLYREIEKLEENIRNYKKYLEDGWVCEGQDKAWAAEIKHLEAELMGCDY